MSLSSSLNAGVSGLNANATRLATISDNISNASTFGYRRARADFQSVMSSTMGGGFSAGGVRASSTRLIGEGGALIASNHPTDLAVSGRGMLPVTSSVAVSGGVSPLPFMMTSTGAFRADADGYLRTGSGLTLMGWPANADGTIPSFGRESAAGLKPVNVNHNQFVGSPTSRLAMELNLPATHTKADALGEPIAFMAEYYSNVGTTEYLDIALTPTVPATGASNEWTLTVTDPESGAQLDEYIFQFGAGTSDGGALVSVDPAGSFDPDTGTVQIDLGGQVIDLVIGPQDGAGITQLSDSFSIISLDRNGAPAGNLVSVEVDANGMVIGNYDTGRSRVIYQIPVVDVPNPNGLSAIDGQTYQASQESGAFYLWNAGEGPAGSVAGYSQMESATDVAEELTQMIRTQRAYSSSAKLIQTVDEMLQETTNIKR